MWQVFLLQLGSLLLVEFLTICALQYVQRKRVECGDESGGWQFLHFVGIIFMAWLAIMLSFAMLRTVITRNDEPPVPQEQCTNQNPGEGDQCNKPSPSETSPATSPPR